MPSVLGRTSEHQHASHVLHDDERSWPETNCYVDVWIEVLHSLGLEPTAALPFTLGLDFEGDQYTFFKFSLDELWLLYGVEVQELNVWRPLAEQAAEQTSLGRFFMPEVDSYYLPDTAGITYGIDHGKSTIAIDFIDIESKTLRYFHNRGYFTLTGADFDGVFRLDDHAPKPGILPPFAEIAKLDRIARHSGPELAARSLELLRRHVGRRPRRNPIATHRARFAKDLEWLAQEPLRDIPPVRLCHGASGRRVLRAHRELLALARKSGPIWSRTGRRGVRPHLDFGEDGAIQARADGKPQATSRPRSSHRRDGTSVG